MKGKMSQRPSKWADQLYQKVVRVLEYFDHGRAAQHYRLGLQFFEDQRYPAALNYFDKAIAVDPRYQAVYTMRGLTQARMGEVELARQDFSQAIKLNADESLNYLQRGICHLRLGLPELAQQDLQIALSLESNDPLIWGNLAAVHHQLGQDQLAIEEFHEAIVLDPQRADWYWGRAKAEQNMGAYQLAEVDLERAIFLDPETAKYREARGVLYLWLEREDEALGEFLFCTDLENATWLSDAAMAYFSAKGGHLDQALEKLTPCFPHLNEFPPILLTKLTRFPQIEIQISAFLGGRESN